MRNRQWWNVLFIACGLLTCRAAVGSTYFWYLEQGQLVRTDLQPDSTSTVVGPLGFVADGYYGGLAYDAQQERLIGLISDSTSDRSRLYEIDRLTGEATFLRDLQPGPNDEWFSGFDISYDGHAVGRTHSTPGAQERSLYRIDVDRGTVSKIGELNLPAGGTDLAFDTSGHLWDIAVDANIPRSLRLRQIDTSNAITHLFAELPVDPLGAVDIAMGWNPDDGMVYWNKSGEFFRTHPNTGQTDFIRSLGVQETVGTFAPIPEPTTWQLVVLPLIMTLSRVRRRPHGH